MMILGRGMKVNIDGPSRPHDTALSDVSDPSEGYIYLVERIIAHMAATTFGIYPTCHGDC